MRRHVFRKGDWVVYQKQKVSDHPAPRARARTAAPKGDYYNYIIDKFWVVSDVLENGHLDVVTRRGKHHILDPGDPRLRKANWFERLFYSGRFRAVANGLGPS